MNMNDQAKILRKKLNEHEQTPTPVRTVAIISGKGGVGKSNFALNFSIELSKRGHRVLLLDMDVGMGNIEILTGVSPSHTLADFFSEHPVPLKNLVTELPGGGHFIAGGTGLSKMPQINKTSYFTFTEQFASLLENYQYIIFDMSAGINETSLQFILSVDETVVITTPEPTSITDAYSAMKHIILEDKEMPLYVIVNRSQTNKEGAETFERLSNALRQFLQKEAIFLGIVPDDPVIAHAVKSQVPFIQLNAKAPSSRAMALVTERYCQREFTFLKRWQKERFASRLKYFLFKR